MENIRVRSILLYLIILLAFHGCSGIYSVVEFEVLEPATVNFPDHINQLLVLNRAPFTLDVLKEEDRKGMEMEHLKILDTLISNNTFRGLQQVLSQSPIDRFHRPLFISERLTDTTSLVDLMLTKREVTELCSQWGADAILSLEFYSLDVNEHYDYYTDAPEIVQNHYFEISNQVRWNIHLPESPKPFDTYTTSDTIYFSNIIDGSFLAIPPITGMIGDLFYNSGAKYGSYLVPVWTPTTRNLYKGKGDSLKLASKYTDEGKWVEAFDLWKDLTRSSDSVIVSKAFHNMAIYYELEDNLDSASRMVNKALEYDSLEIIKAYREELDIRLINQKEVRQQVK